MLVYRKVPKPSKIVDAVKTMHFSMADLDSHGNYTWNSKSNQSFLMVVYFLGWLVHEGFFVWGIIISLEVVSLTTLIEWFGPAKNDDIVFSVRVYNQQFRGTMFFHGVSVSANSLFWRFGIDSREDYSRELLIPANSLFQGRLFGFKWSALDFHGTTIFLYINRFSRWRENHFP